MTTILCALCIILFILVLFALKVHSLHQAADELRQTFAEKIKTDSNTGISLSTRDRKMLLLAAELDQARKQLRKEHLRYAQGDRELKAAVTNISHDLRTPLTAICGYLTLLADEEVPDNVREYLSIIENRIQALTDLSEELFRYSVIVSSDSYGNLEQISLNNAIEESIAAYYAAFIQAGIEPQIVLPEKPVYGMLNRQAFSRILSNIIGNAIKYSDGDFYVTLEDSGRMHFKNHAAHLDEIRTAHLFDRLYTVQNARSSTGLGLSIARKLTREMQGQINAVYCDNMLHIILMFPAQTGL